MAQAEAAAKVDLAIERELLERLKQASAHFWQGLRVSGVEGSGRKVCKV